MTNELQSQSGRAEADGKLVIDDWSRTHGMRAVSILVEDKQEALLFMDMLGLIDPLPGNEPVKDTQTYRQKEYNKRARDKTREARRLERENAEGTD